MKYHWLLSCQSCSFILLAAVSRQLFVQFMMSTLPHGPDVLLKPQSQKNRVFDSPFIHRKETNHQQSSTKTHVHDKERFFIVCLVVLLFFNHILEDFDQNNAQKSSACKTCGGGVTHSFERGASPSISPTPIWMVLSFRPLKSPFSWFLMILPPATRDIFHIPKLLYTMFCVAPENQTIATCVTPIHHTFKCF